MKSMGVVCWVSSVLLVVGGVNWGLIGVFHYNLVSHIFGEGSSVTRIVYGLVGLAALYTIWMLAVHCKDCKKD